MSIPGVAEAATVGGQPGLKVRGFLSDSTGAGRLDFRSYLVTRAGQPSALMTFFCPASKCDDTLISTIVNSVKFTS